ncbi:MAG TPA: GNAT family N-acetyltransferase [Acidimicrobiales bacterium]|nr:GNAT family N-acetyltransferase [Acidimicrobiales bacterium]
MAPHARLGIEAGTEGVDAVLADGSVVRVRPITPADGPALSDFHENLSFESRYFRFFSPHPKLRPEEVERFTTVDGSDRVALVATDAGRLVAVGRYDRLGDGTGAEVAFVVADAHQGRGLGSLLLEHLAAVAANNGITRFVAETLPSNQRMLRVFRDAGFPVRASLDEGVVHVEFSIDPNPRSREISESREHRAESRSIARLLAPRSIAVVGASRDRESVGQDVFRSLLRGGFAGPVYPVNPGAGHVASVRAYDSVLDVPGPVDLAVIGVPAPAVLSVVEQCGQKGVTSIVVLSNGFAEEGEEGAAAQEDVRRLARTLGMRLVGPNAIGVVNTDREVSMNATLASYEPVAGVAGFLSQSAALGVVMLAAAADTGLGVSSFVSVGNKADVSGNDLLQFWEDDPRTQVILLYLESFGNPRKFGRLARRVGATKPIIAVRSGPGSAAAAAALFRQAGVIRVDTVQQMFDVGRLLAYQPLPAGDRLGIVTNALGPAHMAVDAGSAAGLDVGAPIVDLSLRAAPDDFRGAVARALEGGAADALLVIVAPTRSVPAGEVFDALAAACAGASVPVVVSALARERTPPALAAADGRLVPCFRTPEEAVQALGAAASYAAWRRRPASIREPVGLDIGAARSIVDAALGEADGSVALDPATTRALLAAFGIELGEPVEDSRDVVTPHGVSLRTAIVQDPAFGPLVTVAMGGRTAELLGDEVVRAVPLTDADARDLWATLRTAPLLTGYGNLEPADTEAVEDLVLRLGAMADAIPEIQELVLSPVFASAAGVRVGAAGIDLAASTAPATDAIRRLR